MRRPLAAQALELGIALASTAFAGEPSETLTPPNFGRVALYAPAGAPDQVVLFVSGNGGWNRKRPILVGYSSGATLVYAALVAAPPETFAGAISLGFCPDLEIHNAPCRRAVAPTAAPWP